MAKQQKPTYPSDIDRPYFIKFDTIQPFKKDAVISGINGRDYNIKLLKYYKNTWFKRILRKLGFKVRINEYKVIKTY